MFGNLESHEEKYICFTVLATVLQNCKRGRVDQRKKMYKQNIFLMLPGWRVAYHSTGCYFVKYLAAQKICLFFACYSGTYEATDDIH